jgi:hypothetical protein
MSGGERGVCVTFDQRRIEQIERSLGRKLTDEERRLFLSGATLEVKVERQSAE